jgi:class 3 adenylate cyclase/DNA-binding transcriptional ArsR family regulator
MKFCGQCGSPLTVACPSCQQPNPPDFKFCGACGTSLAAGDTQLSQPGRDTAERRQLTVMFCDLVNSTVISERLDPEDLREVVQRYQAVVSQVVDRYDGHIAQYLGDGVLVYFGYPKAHEQDVLRAVMTGLEIIDAIAELNGSIDAEYGVPIEVRIGLHTGPVVAGEIGTGAQTSNLALGATPNLAARVQALAQPGEVLLSEASYAVVTGEVDCEPYGTHQLRGIADPVVVYRARALATQRGQSDRHTTPFFGRESELELLIELLEKARHGEGQVIELKGEPGIGKSRLQDELRIRAVEDTANWLTCRCSAFHENVVLYPIRDLLYTLLDVGRDEKAVVTLTRLTALLSSLDLAEPQNLDVLAELLSLPPPDGAASELSAEQRRHATFDLLLELLRRYSHTKPLVLAVEDLHWADPSTLDFLEMVVSEIAFEPLLVCLSYRPEFQPPWQSNSHHTVIELSRLSDHEAALILQVWNLGRELPQVLKRRLLARTDGIPLFLEELTRSLHGSKLIDQSLDSISENEFDKLVPSTLRDSLESRLDALGPTREIAQLGALLGRRFTFSMLRSVTDIDPRTLEQHLARLVESSLVSRSGQGEGARYMFKHALIQDTAYQSMLIRRRRELHERIANVLSTRQHEVGGPLPETLARHFDGAGRFSEAINYYSMAANQALQRWAYAEAEENLRRALSALTHEPKSDAREVQELRLLQMLAIPITAQRSYTEPELFDIYRRCEEIAAAVGDVTDQLHALYNSWSFYCVRGKRAETLSAASAMDELCKRTGIRDRGFVDFAVGSTAHYDGDHVRALAYLNPVADAFQQYAENPSIDLGVVGQPLFLGVLVKSLAELYAGYPDRASATIAAATAYAERSGDPFLISQALNHEVVIGREINRPIAELEAIAQRVHNLAEQHSAISSVMARMWLGWANAKQGDPLGVVELREAIAETRASGTENPLAGQLMLLGEVLLELGRPEDALVALDESLTVCRTTLGAHVENAVARIKGELLWDSGEHDEGRRWLESALERADAQQQKPLVLRAAISLVERLDEASAAPVRIRLREAFDWFDEGHGLPDYVRAKALLEADPVQLDEGLKQ